MDLSHIQADGKHAHSALLDEVTQVNVAMAGPGAEHKTIGCIILKPIDGAINRMLAGLPIWCLVSSLDRISNSCSCLSWLPGVRPLIESTLNVGGDWVFVSGGAPLTKAQEGELTVLHAMEHNGGIIVLQLQRL